MKSKDFPRVLLNGPTRMNLQVTEIYGKSPPPPHTGQVGATTTCSQNKHVGEFLYFKLPKLPVQVKSRPIKDVTKYVLNTDVQFTN